MKETFISQCLEILKREDIKKECRQLFSPLIDLVVNEIIHYIYIIIGLIFIIFTMILAILVILILILRNKTFFNKTT
jgi:hypothetical protein